MLKKYAVKLFYLSLFIVSFNLNAIAENKIAYLDLNYLLNNSLAGKSLDSQLKKIKKKNVDFFNEKENKLRADEKKIITQKNVLSAEEYKKKIKVLSEDIANYKIEKQSLLANIRTQTNESRVLFLNAFQPILSEYSQKENIDLVIQKKNILLGKSNLDITNDILLIFDKQVKKINLK